MSAAEHEYDSGRECPYCGEAILYTEEVLLIQVVSAFHDAATEQIGCQIQLSDDGDYLYEPRYVHLGCAESMLEELDEVIVDMPPLGDNEAILTCQHTRGGGCGSGIRAWEHFALLQVGEIQASRRMPNGQATEQFVAAGAPNTLCLSCLCRLNEDCVSLWSDEKHPDICIVSQFDECEDCVHSRCWKHQHCECDCHAYAHDQQ